jgi:hypothetical protein
MNVMKTVSAKSRRKAMVRSSRLLMLQEHERLEGVEAWWEVGHTSISELAGLPVWASKPSVGRFTGLYLKTGSASGAAGWRLRRVRDVIAKFALRRSEVVKETCPSSAPVKT